MHTMETHSFQLVNQSSYVTAFTPGLPRLPNAFSEHTEGDSGNCISALAENNQKLFFACIMLLIATFMTFLPLLPSFSSLATG